MDSNNQTKFTSPEFQKVFFQRIAEKQNKDGFYCIRQLNKFHQAQFEECIDSAKVNIQNLNSLATSKFSDQFQVLNVRIPGDLEDLSELQYASPLFFPNVQNVNVIFAEGQSGLKKITISQPLFFRGLHVVKENYGGCIHISCENHDVQIIDSNFNGIAVWLATAKQLTVRNSSFRNAQGFAGLQCFRIQSTIAIDNVQFFNCWRGLDVDCCRNINVSVNNIYAEKCTTGCSFVGINTESQLNHAEIVDCETAIQYIFVTNFVIQTCNIIGALKTGVLLSDSAVRYQHIFITQSDEIEEEFKMIDLEDSTFTKIF